MACDTPDPEGGAERPSFIDQLLSIPPSENLDDDEDEFPRFQVIPRDVDL